jgi:hypothetical protein
MGDMTKQSLLEIFHSFSQKQQMHFYQKEWGQKEGKNYIQLMKVCASQASNHCLSVILTPCRFGLLTLIYLLLLVLWFYLVPLRVFDENSEFEKKWDLKTPIL